MARPNLLGLLGEAARWGERAAFSRRRGLRLERWSWNRVRRVAFRVARELEARGVGAGERVALRAPGGPEWVAGFWGCLLRGSIVVPLDVDSPRPFVERVEHDVDARLTIDAGLLEELAARTGEDGAPEPSPPRVGRGDLAEIVFTSGTTSEPKGVCLTHGNLLSNIEPFEEQILEHSRLARLARPLRFLSPLPLTHVYGQVSAVFVPPLLGAEVHFPHSLKARELVESVRRHRVSVMPCVPRQLDVLREHVEREAERRGRRRALERNLERADSWSWPRRWWAFRDVRRSFGWRFLVFAAGGATLSRATELFWRRMGYVVLQGYGLTETGALATLNDPFHSVRGSIGGPLPGREVRVDADGQVLIRGEAVSPGYWREGFQPMDRGDGWLATGDLVDRDATGALYFRGRAKDVIVTAAGQNVFPEDVEAALDADPQVRASAVVAHEGPTGPEPVAVLLLRDGRDGDAALVVSRANEQLAPHQRPRRWLVWPEPDLPRTPGTQKVRKTEVAEWVRTRLAGGPAEPGTSPLAQVIAAVGGDVPERLGDDATLAADLKLDSLGRLELVSALEERFQVDIDESAITPQTTLRELESLLSGKAATAGAPCPYPRWAHRPPWRAVRAVLQALILVPIARAMCWAAVRGREHLGALELPVLFVCNHVSMVDGALVELALPRRLRHRLGVAMQGETLRDWRRPPPGAPWRKRIWGPPLYAAAALLFGVYPLPQKGGFSRSFGFAGELVDRGESLLVFPEGRRSPDGKMLPFLPGVGLMVAGLGVPVVPLRIDGVFELKQRRRYLAWPGEVSITAGAPVRYETETDAAAIASDLERRVAALGRDAAG